MLEIVGKINVCGVYKLYTLENGVEIILYVGSSKEINDACSRHKSMMKYSKYKGTNKDILQNHYDEDQLYFEVIEVCAEDERLEREQYYIEKFNETICNKNDVAKARMSKPTQKETALRSYLNSGERNPNCKLSKEIVDKIRELYQSNELSTYKLSEMFNISQVQVYRIVKGLRWAS